MKTGNSSTISPDAPREPGDLYMALSPDGHTRMASDGNFLYENFGEFVNDCAYYSLKNAGDTLPNDFIVHYRFANAEQIPHWNNNNRTTEDHFKRIHATIKELGLKPENIVRLHPVLYCYSKGLNPLLPENSAHNLARSIDYQFAIMRYSDFGDSSRERTFHGIQTDHGVLLFDATEKGKDLQQKHMSFFVNNFYNPLLETTFLQTMDVIPGEDQKAKINPDLNALYDDRKQPFGVLPESYYTDIRNIPVSYPGERYDMSATLENFICLSGMDKGEIVSMPADTYDISGLLHLSDPQCKEPVIQDEFPNFFSYHDQFDPLEDKFGKAVSESEKAGVMTQIRALARQILKADFPNIRQPSLINKGVQDHRDALKVVKPPEVTPPSKRLIPPPKKKGCIRM